MDSFRCLAFNRASSLLHGGCGRYRPKFTAEGFWMLGILWAHVVILGGLLYVSAAGINWLLFRFIPYRYALVVVLGLIVALFVASGFEIYRAPGHNSAPPANIFRIYKGFFT
jgi:hypothetical protein